MRLKGGVAETWPGLNSATTLSEMPSAATATRQGRKTRTRQGRKTRTRSILVSGQQPPRHHTTRATAKHFTATALIHQSIDSICAWPGLDLLGSCQDGTGWSAWSLPGSPRGRVAIGRVVKAVAFGLWGGLIRQNEEKLSSWVTVVLLILLKDLIIILKQCG